MKKIESGFKLVSLQEMTVIEGSGPLYDYWAPRIKKLFDYLIG